LLSLVHVEAVGLGKKKEGHIVNCKKRIRKLIVLTIGLKAFWKNWFGIYLLDTHKTNTKAICNMLKFRCDNAQRMPGQRSRYSDPLRAGRPADGIAVGGQLFRNRTERPCAHPFSLTMGTGSLSRG
jgi:hypothetical protein